MFLILVMWLPLFYKMNYFKHFNIDNIGLKVYFGVRPIVSLDIDK